MKVIGVKLLCVLAASLGTAATAAGDIQVRLSVKYILDAGGARPTGLYSNEAGVIDVIDNANGALKRFGRGYQYTVTEFQDVAGASQFFDIADDPEFEALEDAAEADPAQFFWSTTATNVFIVQSSGVGAGAAAIPSYAPDIGEELVIFVSVDLGTLEILWVHELGHHNDLYHTFDVDDYIDDTEPDPSPFQCMGAFQCPMGGSDECCCATKIANLNAACVAGGWTQEQYDNLRWNTMSYYGAADCTGANAMTFDNMLMTDDQLDRWTDATRRYHSGEVSGLTYFVDAGNVTPPFDGYSMDPYSTVAAGIAATDPGGGDVVSIRAGSYNETITISDPLTLRATRGSVTIGD